MSDPGASDARSPGDSAPAVPLPPVAAPGRTSGEPWFTRAIVLYALLKLLFAPGLPLIVSDDSMHYVKLSEVLGGQRPWSDWSAFRTPGFPAYLRFVHEWLGFTPSAFVTANTVVGIIMAAALAAILRRQVGPRTAIAYLALMLGFPLLVGYEHVLLTEIITAEWLAIVLWLANLPVRSTLLHGLIVGTAVGMGYMTRQTLLVLLAPMLLAVGLRCDPRRRRLPAALVAVLAGVAGYLGMTYRWNARLADRKSPGISSLAFHGALRYGLIDSSIPEFAPARQAYDELRAARPVIGDTGFGDVPLRHVIRIANASAAEHAGSILFASLARDPIAYVKAVCRNLRLMYGFSPDESENSNWPVAGMKRGFPYGNLRVSPHYREWAQRLHQPFEGGQVVRFYRNMEKPYRDLLLVAALISLVGGIYRLARHDWSNGLIILAPHLFVFAHAALLTGIDRYAFPAYPAIFCVAIWSIALVWRDVASRGRKREGPPPGPAGDAPHAARGQAACVILAVAGLQLIANVLIQP